MRNYKFLKFAGGFLREEDGIGVVEIILILVILIGLVIIFKSNIEAIVNNAIGKINEDSSTITGE